MGMDLTYECLGGNTYSFQLAFYRDCGGVAAPNNPSINFRSASCNRNFNRTLTFISSGETTPICASLATECTNGTFPGAEEYIYRGVITLPAQCTDWIISYSVCCRNNDINTINAPGAADIYTETMLNNTLAACNSSPSFSNDPVPFVCSNQTYCFNNGAIDGDGDSLVYSLVTPKTGPNLADTVVFLPGFSAQNPITSTPMLTLDSVTGDLCMFPTDSNQIGVLAVLVEEYRNGVKIGSIRRDIQLRILGCPNGNTPPSVSGIDSTANFNIKVCAGDTVAFDIYSADPDSNQTVSMAWNNAITGANFNVGPGNRPSASFDWSPAFTDIRVNPYCFTVTVSDDNCPFESSQVFSYCIIVTGITSLIDSIEATSCLATCDGIGAVQLVNGTPPYTYQWNDPAMQTTAIANGLCPGVYMITGTDSTGCQTTTSLAITEPDTLKVDGIVTSDYNGSDISCFGLSDGAASANITGGTPPYSFSWDANANNQMTDTAIGLKSGTYSFTVTDANGCDSTTTVQLIDPPILTGNTQIGSDFNGQMISCFGANDGILVASSTGGIGQKTYTWDANAMNQTTDSAFNLPSGVYSVTITDQNGCDTTYTDSLQDPPPLATLTEVVSDYEGSQISCYGSSDGIAKVVVSGGTPGYSYQWDVNAGSSTTDSAFNLGAGAYQVVIRDTNNCIAIDTVELTEPDSLTFNVLSKVNVFCNGQNTGSVEISAIGGTPGFSYSWNTVPPTLDSVVTNLGMGSYTVTVTDSNGCTGDTTIFIDESQPLAANITGLDLSCNGYSDGMAYSTPGGGNPPFNYRWTTNLGIQGSDTARNLTATTHYLTITDSRNCTTTDSITLSEPPAIALTTSANDTVCANTAVNISANATGGTGNTYTYSWNQGLGTGANKQVSLANTTLYIVEATDSIGCISPPAVITVFVRDFSEDSLNLISAGDICEGDTGSVLAEHSAKFNQYTYDWNPGNGTDVGPISVSPDSSTYYTLRITDICGNILEDSILVNVLYGPTIDLPDTMEIGCNPQEVTFVDSLNLGSGYQYQWNFGDGSSSIDPIATHLYNTVGTFNVGLTVIGNNGCSTSDNAASIVKILNTPIASFEANPAVTNMQSPIITFSNQTQFASNYLWKFGDDSTSTEPNPLHVYQDSGIYEVILIATNQNGCLDSTSYPVIIEPFFEIRIPNAFTPNPNRSSGGKYDPEALDNDVFFPHTTGVTEYSMKIFNRWGELIFESRDHNIGWDGYYKGKLSQQEVYVYELSIEWINGQQLKKVGDVTLFR